MESTFKVYSIMDLKKRNLAATAVCLNGERLEDLITRGYEELSTENLYCAYEIKSSGDLKRDKILAYDPHSKTWVALPF